MGGVTGTGITLCPETTKNCTKFMKQWFSRYWTTGKKGQVILERQETNEVSPTIAPVSARGEFPRQDWGGGIQMETSKHLDLRWSWGSKEATVAGVSRSENWRGKYCAEFQRSAEGSLCRS